MATITLKNIPENIYLRLKTMAKVHHRSISDEILHCLEIVLKPRQLSVDLRLERLRAVRPKLAVDLVSADDIQKAIDKGRL